MTTKLHPYIVKDTGVQLNIRKVSPNILMEFQRKFNERHPEPEPPAQPINYGDEQHPDWRTEKNESHPDYKKAIQDRRDKLNNEMQTLMIRRGVVLELTDEDKQAVKELRQSWKDDYDSELEQDDKEVFIRYIAIGTAEDMRELVTFITRRTQPTEVAVDEQLKSI